MIFGLSVSSKKLEHPQEGAHLLIYLNRYVKANIKCTKDVKHFS